jgi:hypothetical protein
VLLAAVAVRLITDPGTWAYYTPGLVVGALVWDTFEAKRLMPWTTIVASLLLMPSWIDPSADLRAWLRLVAGVVAVVAVLATGRRNDSVTESPDIDEPDRFARRGNPDLPPLAIG